MISFIYECLWSMSMIIQWNIFDNKNEWNTDTCNILTLKLLCKVKESSHILYMSPIYMKCLEKAIPEKQSRLEVTKTWKR